MTKKKTTTPLLRGEQGGSSLELRMDQGPMTPEAAEVYQRAIEIRSACSEGEPVPA